MTTVEVPELLDRRSELYRRGLAVKDAADVTMPRLKYWNYTACAAHIDVGPQVDCSFRKCGGELFAHQRVGIAWLYLVERGLLADVPGLGKTNQIFGLLAVLKEKGELTGRCVIVCQTPAVRQWAEEAQRWVPKMNVKYISSGLTRPERINRYASNWDALIIGYHMLLKDHKMLAQMEPKMLVVDDVDPLLNHGTQTHTTIAQLSAWAERSVVMNATSIQVRLQQIHAALVPVGGLDTFGSLRSFERRYVRQESIPFYNRKTGRKVVKMETVGYKNLDEFKERLRPLVLRRSYEDVDADLSMPEIMPPEQVWLELHPAQRRKYDELQRGVLEMLATGQVKRVAALAKVTYGQQICAGLPALHEPDGPEASVKLDWCVKQVLGPWADKKAVFFVKNLGMVEAFQNRLARAGVGYATVWGKNKSDLHRQGEIERFWADDNCRVFMGTAAIERSLNLQVANIVVNVDTHLNPARMLQILGRVRRAGSRHKHVFVFNLFTRATQEENYLTVLEQRQAVADFVWGEENDLYEALSPIELLMLLKP